VSSCCVLKCPVCQPENQKSRHFPEMRLFNTKKPRTVLGSAAFSFYVWPSSKPSSKPPAYDNYSYALYDPDAAADFILMIHG
jgi:hypothetical protein